MGAQQSPRFWPPPPGSGGELPLTWSSSHTHPHLRGCADATAPWTYINYLGPRDASQSIASIHTTGDTLTGSDEQGDRQALSRAGEAGAAPAARRPSGRESTCPPARATPPAEGRGRPEDQPQCGGCVCSPQGPPTPLLGRRPQGPGGAALPWVPCPRPSGRRSILASLAQTLQGDGRGIRTPWIRTQRPRDSSA